MAKYCHCCGKELGFLEGRTLQPKQCEQVVCKACKHNIDEDVRRLSEISSSDDLDRAISRFVLGDQYPAEIMVCIDYLAHKKAFEKNTVGSTFITVKSGQEKIDLNSFWSFTQIIHDREGFIHFASCPEKKFVLEDIFWNGPKYRMVTSTTKQTSNSYKGKTKRKGGLSGAIIGSAIAPGVGTVIGYLMTSEKVTKGKSNRNVKVVSNTYPVEIDTDAILKITDDETGELFSIMISCDSKKRIELENYKMVTTSSNIEVQEIDLNPYTEEFEESEINEGILFLLRKYKELQDLEIITDEEFEFKKKDLLVRNLYYKKIDPNDFYDNYEDNLIDEDIIFTLRQNKELLDLGMINEEEFMSKKKELLKTYR